MTTQTSDIETYLQSTERLRRMGVLTQAVEYREEQRKRLRAEGKSREEARETAWRLMNEKFPPTEVSPGIKLPVDSMPLACQVKVLREMNAGDPLDVARDARWVYEHLPDPLVEPLDAPSPGAWSLFVYARQFPQRFFEKVLPRLLVSKAG